MPGPSAKPAMVVIAMALVIFIGGSIALGLGPTTAPSSAPPAHAAAGAKLSAQPAGPLLKPLRVAGQPPTDILNALLMPAGATPVPGSARDRGVETYDRLIAFQVRASQADVIDFFQAELRANGWQQVSTGAARNTNGVDVLGQHASVDGNLWEIGVVVSPSQFTSSAAGSTGASTTAPTGASTDITRFSVELYVRSLSA